MNTAKHESGLAPGKFGDFIYEGGHYRILTAKDRHSKGWSQQIMVIVNDGHSRAGS